MWWEVEVDIGVHGVVGYDVGDHDASGGDDGGPNFGVGGVGPCFGDCGEEAPLCVRLCL